MKQKKAVVRRAWLSSCCLVFALVMCSCQMFAQESNGQEGQKAKEGLCTDLTPGWTSLGGADLQSIPQRVGEILKDLPQEIRSNNARSLVKRFHPRIAPQELLLKSQLRAIQDSLGNPLEIAIEKLWLLESPNKAPLEIRCDEKWSVYSHYGYTSHYAVWLSLKGARESGKIFVSLVPLKELDGNWVLGTFDWSQTTRGGREATDLSPTPRFVRSPHGVSQKDLRMSSNAADGPVRPPPPRLQ